MRYLRLALLPLLLVACTDTQAPLDQTPEFARRTDIQRLPDVVAGLYQSSCPSGFDILADWTGEIFLLMQNDKDGNPHLVVQGYHVNGRSSYYNSNRPDLIVYGGPAETQIVVWHYDQDWIGISGPAWRVVLPGVGPIFIDVGVIKVNLTTFEVIHEAGTHQMWNSDFAALCEALTP